MIGLVCAVSILAGIVWLVWRSGETLTSSPLALMLMIFSVAVAMPIQGYDLCCYAPGIALIATRTRGYQVALFVPPLLIWLPALLHKLNPVAFPALVPMVAWLSLLVCTCVMVAASLQFGRTPAAENHGLQRARSPGLGAEK